MRQLMKIRSRRPFVSAWVCDSISRISTQTLKPSSETVSTSTHAQRSPDSFSA